MSAAGGCHPQRELPKDYFFFLAAFFVAFFFVATYITSFRGHVRGYGLNSRTQTRVMLVLTYFFFWGAFFAAFFFAAMYLTSFRHHIPSAVFTIFQTTDGVGPLFP
jgi:uncharacterized membrane protein required for colicin V production